MYVSGTVTLRLSFEKQKYFVYHLKVQNFQMTFPSNAAQLWFLSHNFVKILNIFGVALPRIQPNLAHLTVGLPHCSTLLGKQLVYINLSSF